jgi:hypothetical protein
VTSRLVTGKIISFFYNEAAPNFFSLWQQNNPLPSNAVSRFGLAYPVLLVPGVGAVQELQGDVVVLVEPLHDEGLEPGGVLRHLALVRRHLGHVRLVQPFYPEHRETKSRSVKESKLLTDYECFSFLCDILTVPSGQIGSA